MIVKTEAGGMPVIQVKRRAKMISRLSFIVVIAAFVLPLLLAITLYAQLDAWTPPARVNHGELMEPVKPLSMLMLSASDKTAITLDDVQGIWTLAYIGKEDCSIHCQAGLFKMRQVKEMLGRESARLQSMFVALDDEAMDSVSLLAGQYPNLRAGLAGVEIRSQQENAFSPQSIGSFFLLDPHGNVVLRYDDDSTTKGLLKDLKRLLKVSRIG